MNTREFENLLYQVKNLVLTKLINSEDIVEDTCEIPNDIKQNFINLGLFGLTIPKRYGGLGATYEQTIKITEILGYTSPAFQYLIGSNNGIGIHPILYSDNEILKQELLPKIASGHIISFALTESSAGSDPSSIETTYKKVNEGYIINGEKLYVSNISCADYVIIIAKEHGDNKENVSSFEAFLINTNNPGMTIGKIDKKMGHNGSPTASLLMQDVFIPKDKILSSNCNGLKLALRSINIARLISSALAVGMTRRILEESIKYALTRKQFNKSISEFQLIQDMIARSVIDFYSIKALVDNTAKLADIDIDSAKIHISSCKYNASEIAFQIADRAVQIHGAKGYMSGFVERCFRDTRLFRIYEGTNEIQKLYIAKNIYKLFNNKSNEYFIL